MNKQQTFDTIMAHLRKQGKPAMVKHPEANRMICAYRGVDNTMCAVGCLIPDQFYRPDMENKGADVLFVIYKKLARHLGISQSDYKFLLEIQRYIHDEPAKESSGDFMAWVELRAEKFAEKHNLTYTAP